LKDKNWETMIKEILPITSEIIFTNPDEKRGLSPYVLSEFVMGKKKNIKSSVIPEVKEAFEEIKKKQKPFLYMWFSLPCRQNPERHKDSE